LNFYKKAASENRIVKRNPILSVCITVCNEDKHLLDCIESIKDIADEIIIADIGSTDMSVPVGESFGANIVNLKPESNISDARNSALRAASLEWVLFLNADEIVPHEQAQRIKDLIRKTDGNAYYLSLKNQENVSGGPLLLRLFKQDMGVKFSGGLYEMIEPEIICDRLSGTETDIVIENKGFKGNG
jgi:glycosyltransferase involved in cell wall biosynthesis